MKKTISLLITILGVTLTACSSSGEKNESKVYWDKETDQCLKETIGDFISELPVYSEALSYAAQNFSQDVNYTFIDITTELAPTMSNLVYKTQLVDANYEIKTLESGVYAAYKSVSIEYTLIVQFSGITSRQAKDDYNHLYIYTYLYQDKSTTWPSEDVISVLGEDIPHYSASYYQSSVVEYNGVTYFQIGCYGVGSSSEDEYYQILKNNGYIVRTNSSYINAVQNTKLIELNFYYDSDYECLLIVGYKLDKASVWPETEIRSLFGFDLPVYTDSAITYQSGYMNFEYYEGDERFIIQKYCIECDYAPSSAMLAYDALLKEAGWTVDTSDLPDDWPLFICSEGKFERYVMTDNNGTHSVEIRYYDPNDSLQSGYDLSYPIFLIMINY